MRETQSQYTDTRETRRQTQTAHTHKGLRPQRSAGRGPRTTLHWSLHTPRKRKRSRLTCRVAVSHTRHISHLGQPPTATSNKSGRVQRAACSCRRLLRTPFVVTAYWFATVCRCAHAQRVHWNLNVELKVRRLEPRKDQGRNRASIVRLTARKARAPNPKSHRNIGTARHTRSTFLRKVNSGDTCFLWV